MPHREPEKTYDILAQAGRLSSPNPLGFVLRGWMQQLGVRWLPRPQQIHLLAERENIPVPHATLRYVVNTHFRDLQKINSAAFANMETENALLMLESRPSLFVGRRPRPFFKLVNQVYKFSTLELIREVVNASKQKGINVRQLDADYKELLKRIIETHGVPWGRTYALVGGYTLDLLVDYLTSNRMGSISKKDKDFFWVLAQVAGREIQLGETISSPSVLQSFYPEENY
ncbi:hypothetical protein A2866_03675 [Candidatus Roizmanbacteria bacterium RIFCSPHIGHO2_01_FULL_39_8]|uniref:Uncharacterized protein n=1 Tax=Candidatus Roizmanbacteria bacterium RIFCSPHIGHO2_01_FULL_39_8 TaxID=1802033 RepID=A0A1F7GLG4_9BACT|nr:MAG: hypothetical protein A2866_03675 [Candidatus Roizmanbacteria bacterium RIFCSPHIGHO2_01_FULL_39_8]